MSVSVIEYKDGRVVRVDGIHIPEYSLREQLILRIGIFCLFHEPYHDLILTKAIEKYNQDHLGEPDLLEGNPVDPDEFYVIAERLKKYGDWISRITQLPCGQYPLGNGKYTIYDPEKTGMTNPKVRRKRKVKLTIETEDKFDVVDFMSNTPISIAFRSAIHEFHRRHEGNTVVIENKSNGIIITVTDDELR